MEHNYLYLGIQLGVPPHKIKAWENLFQKDAVKMLDAIVHFLFDNNSNPKEILYYALKKMHQPILAKELKSKYGGSQGNNIVFHKYC